MKKLFTLSALSLLALGAQAQITIDQSSFASWTPGNATFRGVAGFTASPANNGSWDLSPATYGLGFTIDRAALTLSSLPQVTYGEPGGYSSGTFSYETTLGYGITTDGVQRFGENMDRQAIGLGTLTGNTNDSLVFNAQVIAYSAPRTIIGFPATANSTWGSSYNYTTTFALTLGMYGLNNAPCLRRTFVERADSVKGWGEMRVQDLNNDATGYMDVLAVETIIEVKDSFFLNGSPAPTPMLTAFGLTQGQVETTYYTYYYRAGEVDPLLTVEYDDETRSNITSSYTHADRLPANVKNVLLSSAVKMYPNPSVNGTVTLEAAELNKGNWAYEVVNIAGQKVAAGQLQVANGTATINVNNAGGTYFVNLSKDGVRQATKTLVLQ